MTADFHYPADRSRRVPRGLRGPTPTDGANAIGASANGVRAAATSSMTPPPSLLRPSWQRPPIAAKRASPDTAVVTMLTPEERTRVDAAGEGCYTALHRDTLDEVLQDLRECRAQAVLVSVARCNARAASSVARLVREFPAVPAVALWCESTADSPHAVLALGHYGVQSLVDVREPAGWRTLRQLFTTQRGDRIERRAVGVLGELLANAPEDCRRFIEACFTSPARVCTVRQLARRLGVQASTLMSRFYRANLPAPKRYLSFARLVRAASLFENPGLSITQVANTLEYSSPQSFGRHVHTMLGVSAVTFRREFDGARMLDRFVDELITPHMHTLREFHPLVIMPPYSRLRSPE
jgi:AraC-like DNA-binding protein